jgi:twitching motility protein PilT
MRRPDLDNLLLRMMESYPGVSDINFTVDKPPQVESFGELKAVSLDPPLKTLLPYHTENIALSLLQNQSRLIQHLIEHGSCDLSYRIPQKARFRVNIFSQRGNYSVVMRKLEMKVPTIQELNLPAVFFQMCEEKNGIVLFTGATGTGKTTSLAAIIDEINQKKAIHIITLEDPIEFEHSQRAGTVNQREMGSDFDTFANGLRAALRQAPKVILVGEIRDKETAQVALRAAETGHLVLSTLHTIDAGTTVNRLIGLFETGEEKEARLRFADSLRWVVSQRLLPKTGGGRQAVFEVMGTNLRVRELLLNGETPDRTFYGIITDGEGLGMQTFESDILKVYENGYISEETAMAYSIHSSVMRQKIDRIKSKRGEKTTDIEELDLDSDYGRY